MKNVQQVAAVIRSYKNPGIAEAVTRLFDANIAKVIVVVKADDDYGSTRGFLRDYLNDSRLEIMEVWTGYTWSNALNRALCSIKMHNISTEDNILKYKYVLNVSVEARLDRDHIEKMISVMDNDPSVGVVGTSFQGMISEDIIPLGTSYNHPRNTGCLIRLDMGGFEVSFDSRCDDLGGMEDIDFIFRMELLSSYHYEMLDMKALLTLGKYYNQEEKELREGEAIRKIIGFYRTMFEHSDPKNKIIIETIEKMGL